METDASKCHVLYSPPFCQAVWTWDHEVIGDTSKGLSHQTLHHLMDQKNDVLWTRTLHLHLQLSGAGMGRKFSVKIQELLPSIRNTPRISTVGYGLPRLSNQGQVTIFLE